MVLNSIATKLLYPFDAIQIIINSYRTFAIHILAFPNKLLSNGYFDNAPKMFVKTIT